MKYIAIDGDRIGERLEGFLLTNNLEKVCEFSMAVASAVHALRQSLELQGCEILFATGDGVFASSPGEIDISQLPLASPTITFSVGISTSASEALLALKVAKGLGRNRVQER